MNYPVRAQLASLVVVILVVGGAFGAYYLSTSPALVAQEQSISSLKSQVNSLQHLPVSTTTFTTTSSTILTSYSTATKKVTTTTTFSPSSYVQILSVRADLFKNDATRNSTLFIWVNWKNVSNSTYYYWGLGGSALDSSILPTSTAKVYLVPNGCVVHQALLTLKSGDNATSVVPPCGWSYVVTSPGRVDASLTLQWTTNPIGPYPFGNSTIFYYSFQV